MRIPILFVSLMLARLAVAEDFTIVLRSSEPLNHPASTPTEYAAPEIEVPVGTTLEVIAVHGDEAVSTLVSVDGTQVKTVLVHANQKNASRPSKVVGPATVRFIRPRYVSTIINYSLTAGEESSRSDAVVIPDDESGNHRVILEASTDLRVWQEIQPGSYPSTSARRFFRVRILKE